MLRRKAPTDRGHGCGGGVWQDPNATVDTLLKLAKSEDPHTQVGNRQAGMHTAAGASRTLAR